MAPESSPFKVALRDLPAHRRLSVSSAYVDELVRGMPLRDALDEVPAGDGGEAELDLDGDADGKSVFVQGHIAGQVTVACSRCVTPTPIRFDEPVRVTFMPAADLPAEDDEEPAPPKSDAKGAHGKGDKAHGDKAHGPHGAHGGKDDEAELGVELATDDLDVFGYTGEVVDLEPLVREQFILAVPFAPLCKEDCAGLCPQCGVDRNVETCACEKPIDPRFAALQGLKLPPS
ncbi:MAG TPA: DUF177 domain-containing protein [Kofleriaceae bacterium]|nr:DUF177 domain-containing protein [Kofleriaceae bacterium]